MANEKRLIDANALKRYMIKAMELANVKTIDKDDIAYAIDNTNTVDAVEVVHGRWKFLNDYQSRCSECHEVMWVDHNAEPNFCPNCGAKMDGGNDNV